MGLSKKWKIIIPTVGVVTAAAIAAPTAILLSQSSQKRDKTNFVDEQSYKPPKVEVPAELFPGIKQDPEEYDRLKNDPFVISTDSSNRTIAKNNFVTFAYEDDVKQKLEAKGKSIQDWSTYFFKTFASSPTANLQEESGDTHNVYFDNTNHINSHNASGLTRVGNIGIVFMYDKFLTMSEANQVFPKEYSQFEFGATFAKSKPLPNEHTAMKYAKDIYNGVLNDLEDSETKAILTGALTFETDKIIVSPWSSNPGVSYQGITSWTKNTSHDWKDFATNLNSYTPYMEDPFLNVQPDDSVVLETLGHLIFANSLQLENYSGIEKSASFILHMQILTNMLHGYNLFDENKPKQSFDIMKSILHNEFDLAAKSGLSLSLGKDGNGNLFINKVFFKSFGSEYTNDLKEVQIIDKATGNLLKTMPITHKNYPIGFSKNIFNDYEYKYVAPGAYAIDNKPSDWMVANHKVGELDFKIVKNDGSELPKTNVMFQENIGSGWPEESYYLADDGLMHSTDEIYK